jgi:hypothetical protein
MTVRERISSAKVDVNRRLLTRLVRSGRIPRYAYQHYFIEAEGLHSRVHLQNFFATMFPHIRENVRAHVTLYSPQGSELGSHDVELPPFGSLFVEARDLLAKVGAGVPEGSLTIDLRPPGRALEELASFPFEDPWDLRIQTPYWMAYYDDAENYMYVHSISTYSGAVYGVEGALGWIVRRTVDPQGTTWRSGRLLDAGGLEDLQIVVLNHAAAARSGNVRLLDADSHEPIWVEQVDLAPHELRRVRVDLSRIRDFASRSARGQFQIGIDPLPTPNGKPYVLMRYGNGPLSIHHG